MTFIQYKENPPWKLPESYSSLKSKAQSEVVRACIINFLDHAGKARIREIQEAIGLPERSTILNSLKYLVSTQQLYSDGAVRDPTYYKNGKLAHPLLQSNVKVGRREYVLRTYKGEIGKWITVTEYERNYLNELRPRAGIRIDVENVELIINELSRIKRTINEDRSLLESPTLKRGRKNGIY